MKLREELIGREVAVVAATNASLVGLFGVVEDETRQTLVVAGRRIAKDCVTFRLDCGTEVPGSRLVGRSWQRLARVRKQK